jgi:hypothetical protein
MKEAEERVRRIGFAHFKSLVLGWFEALGAPSTKPLSPHNCQVVKGLAWSCAPFEDAELSRALGRLAEAMLCWIPQFPAMDWRGLRAGNAALYALSVMPGEAPVAELSRLSARLKGKQLQDSVNKAIATASERRGMSRADLEEVSVPVVDEQPAEEGAPGNARRRRASAAQQASAAQRIRLERLLAAGRSWILGDWRQRYERQPLLAPLVSRLIWSFETPAGSELGMPKDGRVTGVDGADLALEAESTRVRLWHPIDSDAETVRRWRRLLEERRIVQPFKQAHREIYVSTDADTSNPRGSDRFAGHLIRQDRFKALCDDRDWRYSLQGWFMKGDGIASRTLEEQDLRAQLEVRPAGEDGDRGGIGAFPFLATGSARFLYADSSVCPPDLVPPAAFSEVMRDIDLFVGVCSIGVDPSWSMPARYAAAWRDQALTELSEAAASRRETLAELLPRLSFASRCELEGRFLIVHGDLRTYKIHVGSGNVLMSPNDQFLYVPPPRRVAGRGEEVFLPFEGDTLLAQILSRAAVLAADSRISDRALRSQILAGGGGSARRADPSEIELPGRRRSGGGDSGDLDLR